MANPPDVRSYRSRENISPGPPSSTPAYSAGCRSSTCRTTADPAGHDAQIGWRIRRTSVLIDHVKIFRRVRLHPLRHIVLAAVLPRAEPQQIQPDMMLRSDGESAGRPFLSIT